MSLIDAKWGGANIKTDASNRLVTDTEKSTWNGKCDVVHAHDYIVTIGAQTCESELEPLQRPGISYQLAYNNGYPENYGNVLNLNGLGQNQIMVTWPGNGTKTQPNMYFRGKTDNNADNWTIWLKVLNSSNYTEFAATKDHTHNTTITDWNNAITSGFYNSAAGASNAPVSDAGITGNVSATGNMIAQVVYPENMHDVALISYTRKGINNSGTIVWSKWIRNIILLKTPIIKTGYYEFKELIPSTVTSIIFTDAEMPSDATLIDVDADGDGGVVAWLDTSDNTKMYVSTQEEAVKVEATGSIKQFLVNCSTLTSVDLSTLDTSKVTDMTLIFQDCSSLTSVNVSNFDTSNVTKILGLFSGCSSLTSVNVSNFDTSNVTDMQSMFKNCSSLTELDVSKFDTSKVTSMGWMFLGCSSLTKLDVSKFDTSKVTDMKSMFNNCSSLTYVSIYKFDTSNVTNMQYMFSGCSSLKSLNVSNFNTSNVTDIQYMFNKCSSLTSLDLSKWDTSKVTSMDWMFSGCSSLTSIKVGNKFKWVNTISGIGAYGTWQDEEGNTYAPSDTFPSNVAHTYTKVS